MKVIAALVVAVMLVTVLAIAALVQLVIWSAPFLLVALIVTLVVRARRSAARSRPVTGTAGRSHPLRVAAAPQYRVGAPSAAPGGWVMVPVWVAPTPGPPVIDGEVLGGRD
jgi:hypothetical protein